MRRRISLVVPLLVVAVVAVFAGRSMSAQAADPLIGTWKLDVAKSKFNPGPAAKSSIAVFAAQGTGLKVSIDGVSGTDAKSADGKTLTVTQTGTNAQGQKVNNVLVYTKG